MFEKVRFGSERWSGLLQWFNKYLSSMEGSFSCRWGFTPVIGRMFVDKALMV